MSFGIRICFEFRPARHLCACVMQSQLHRSGISNIPSRQWIAQARQAGIQISDFDLLFGAAKTFARLCKEILGHNTRFSK